MRALLENTWVDGNGKVVIDWIVLMTGVVFLSVAVVGTVVSTSQEALADSPIEAHLTEG